SDINIWNRSGLHEDSNNKNTQGTLKVSKISRTGSATLDTRSPLPMAELSSPVSKPRVSVNRSPKSANSKTPNKKTSTPDLQEKLDAVEMDLKKAKEQLASVELEKMKANEELNKVKMSADEVNEKFQEATVAKKKAEEALEIEKFQFNELEQASKKAAQKREEEFQKELKNVQSQHNQDVSALNSMNQELQRIKMELIDVTNAKEIALVQATDAKKTAEIYEEKVELLSEEVSQLKALHDSKLDSMNKEAADTIKKLDAEVTNLKFELERAKTAQEKLVQMEALVEKLQLEMIDARKGELDVAQLVDEWRKKAEMLKIDLEEAYQSEKSASDSLAAMMEKLEASKSLFDDAESEISTLRGTIKSLEIEVAKQKIDLEESDRQLDLTQQDALNIGKTIELLKLELHNLEEEKLQAINSEKVTASKIKSLIEENNKLMDDLKNSKDEEAKAKKAIEDLASALQAMSIEAREKDERLLKTQTEIEESQADIEQLNIALRNTKERYEVMLDEARYEVVCLKKILERFETEASNTNNEWDEKEFSFVNTIKELEEETVTLKVEMSKMVDLQKLANQKTLVVKEDVSEMLTKLRLVESGTNSAYKEAEASKYESLQLKETLLDMENELQSITQENDDLCIQEAAATHKVRELSAALKQAISDKIEENCEISDSGEYNLEKNDSEVPYKNLEDHHKQDHKQKEKRKEIENVKEDLVEVMENGLSSERNHEDESTDDDLQLKMNGSSNNLTNGMTGSIDDETTLTAKQHQQQKKKKPLLHKFGNLLKKGNH
ncbi:hypothetical protein BHE74_00048977, partial [Ensete ventricosum]